MTVAQGEFIAGLGLAGWGVWFYLLAEKFPEPLNPFDVGPGAFPKIISLILFILGLALSGRAILKFKSSGRIIIKRKENVAASGLLLIVYALAIPLAGYYIATTLFILAMLLLAGERRWVAVAVITGAFLLFALSAFDVLLGVPLPK